ncbi:hypothetical protein [Lacinutrix jangbogonensis]|uniref:hypothetical protein n=1 Tax=Lacinutrix jangbogonensis TaxID=1469557 RepID=UPI00053D6348|nr:hypothetical protein [Lacinutrix jangbogonensis]
MKTIKSILSIIFILIFININAQSQKQLEREKNKVELFSMKEYANLHIWFESKVDDMKMTKEVDDQYYSILSMYTGRMSRLNDKDKNFSKNEITEKFNALVVNLNDGVKPILNVEQNDKHSEIMKTVSRAILNKLNIKE